MAQITGPKAIDDKEQSMTTFAKERSCKLIWNGLEGVGGLREAASFTHLSFPLSLLTATKTRRLGARELGRRQFGTNEVREAILSTPMREELMRADSFPPIPMLFR